VVVAVRKMAVRRVRVVLLRQVLEVLNIMEVMVQMTVALITGGVEEVVLRARRLTEPQQQDRVVRLDQPIVVMVEVVGPILPVRQVSFLVVVGVVASIQVCPVEMVEMVRMAFCLSLKNGKHWF
jgi:hypothetical protein